MLKNVERKGVWKDGTGKGRKTPKGRQLDDQALIDVRELLGDKPRRRCLLYTSPSPRDLSTSRMPSSA